MITDTDIKKLMVVFPTRAELNTRLDEFATKTDLENMTGVLLEAIDKVAQGMDVMKHEYTAIGLKSDRHINDKSVHLNPIRS
ncbi:hypothetical protein HY416_04195 [Candidatus Kaiserbacteria bacterium]|nr:hypothetical protein [Candidatus Kaiserbacteria bacterium]